MYDQQIPLLGIHLKNTKTVIPKDTCTLMFAEGLFTIAKTWKQPWTFIHTDERIKNMYIHTYIQTHWHTHTDTHTLREKHT